MEEIKVGEYVRTNDIHYIKRILDFKDNWYTIKDNKDNIGYKIKNKDIVKHSPNIIDLIEVGDYVNGEVVWSTTDKKGIETVSGYYTGKDIKTIVTKEQFEAMEYKVEE